MKLTLIGPVTPYRGGIAHFTTILAKKLIKAGHDIQVISFKKQYPAWLYPGKSDKDTSPGREQVEAEFILSPLNPLTWGRTVKAIAAYNPDKIILSWWVTFWGPAFWFILLRLKNFKFNISVLIHNTIPHEARFFDRTLARAVLRKADGYIVMTAKEKTRLLTLLPQAKNICVSPLPIYQPFPPTGKTKLELREDMGLPVDQPVLLFFGFIRPYKGLKVLIEALNQLIQQGTKAHLLVVGEFWEDKTAYEALIQTLNVQKYVHIYDSYIPDNEVAAFFEVSDLFVAPYIDSTQSAALKSALAFGLPAVVTEPASDNLVASMPERCKVVPGNNFKFLASAIEKMIEVPNQQKLEIDTAIEKSWDSLVTTLVEQRKNKLQ